MLQCFEMFLRDLQRTTRWNILIYGTSLVEMDPQHEALVPFYLLTPKTGQNCGFFTFPVTFGVLNLQVLDHSGHSSFLFVTFLIS